MIKKVIGLSGGIGGSEVINTRFTRYMQPIVNTTLDSGALDNSQCFLMDIVETDTEWYLYYAGAATQTINYTPDGQDYTNNDATFLAIKTKSNDVKTGWVKLLDVNSDPKPILKPSFISGRFDEWQVWMRSVIKQGSNWKGWFIGDDGTPTFTYRVGYATSSDGQVWTKSGTTPIYEDTDMTSGRGIVVPKVVYNGSGYVMIYAGVDPNISGLFVAQSVDGITSWTKTHSNLFANSNYGFPSDFRYSSGTYYLWLQRLQMMPEGNLGPFREIVLFSSTDLTTWINLGVQIKIRGTAQEFGIGNHCKMMQKPNSSWFMAHTFYVNRTQALAGITKEPATGIKVAESTNTSFIMNSQCDFSFPDYVAFHAPLDFENGLTEAISGTLGTLNSGILGYAERGFPRLSGSQSLTFTNTGINGAHFSIKMRCEVKTTATNNLLKIGNDVWLTLESGKLRVRLSSNGSGYEKDYITSVNISTPSGMDYLDNHIYLGFMWDGSTIRMWNDFVEFTAGQITKTVDNSLTIVNNSLANIVIGDGSAIELRSVSICDEITATEFIELDI